MKLLAIALSMLLATTVLAQGVTVSPDSIKLQISRLSAEYNRLKDFISDSQQKIEQAKSRMVWIEGAANGLQAVLSDTTLRFQNATAKPEKKK